MDEQQYQALVEKVGKEVADKMKKEMAAYDATAKKIAEAAIKDGGITKEQFEEYKEATEKLLNDANEIARKQGLSITELTEKLQKGNDASPKSIAEVMEESKEDISRIRKQGSGVVQFVVGLNKEGKVVATPYVDKAAGPHATVSGIGGGGNVASIVQSLDAATILRLGGSSPIFSQYRNTQWLFDLVNLQNADLNTPFAIWYEETPKQGSSAIVAEGGTKPLVQYAYELKSATYKKEAQLISITDEFAIDFPRLESDIMGKGRTDLLNRINTTILANIIAAATPYSTAAQFATPGVDGPNDFDAIAAMAAQVDDATFGNLANTAIMSTFKKYRMGVEKSTQLEYLNRPEVLNNIAFVGNPAMATDNVIVGDLKQYNVILRGGLIVKVGYNGTDFAENKFSVVMEQFYFDYIPTVRRPAIVTGPTFADVVAQIAAESISS